MEEGTITKLVQAEALVELPGIIRNGDRVFLTSYPLILPVRAYTRFL